MSKEHSPVDLKDPASPILMGKLIESFGNNNWEYDQIFVSEDREFRILLKSPTGKKWIEYIDWSGEANSTEIDFWDGDELTMVFHQYAWKKRIENHITVPPRTDDNFDPVWGAGIHYGPDGEMYPLRVVKGLPKRIDMNATVKSFIEQVSAGKFNRPRLIRPRK